MSLLENAVPHVTMRIIGKPSRNFYLAALSHLGVDDPSGAVMVRDAVVEDVRRVLNAGFGRVVLVRTGKYVEGDETPAALGAGAWAVPTLTVDSIVEEVDYILSNLG